MTLLYYPRRLLLMQWLRKAPYVQYSAILVPIGSKRYQLQYSKLALVLKDTVKAFFLN